MQKPTYDALESHESEMLTEVGHSIGGAIAMGALGLRMSWSWRCEETPPQGKKSTLGGFRFVMGGTQKNSWSVYFREHPSLKLGWLLGVALCQETKKHQCFRIFSPACFHESSIHFSWLVGFHADRIKMYPLLGMVQARAMMDALSG